ncbi:MAG TPA: SMP-30/gluconolactonase/LRE family protein [Burkholderiales bacterium]|nr:SMP-30/gluconolactonase/LRE family protein [Burkholderiales bacterium]
MRRFALAALLAAAGASALAQVRVQEYPLPPRITAHDVWADPAPDGPVWFSGQASGNAGRLDPKTGKVELIPLGEGSAPHGVILDRDGAAWFTDGGQNAIVRVDAKTRAVKKWPLPQGTGYANLNTASFDRAGILWFTGQSGFYGRLDPKTGDLKVFEAPRGGGPYGIQSTPDGTVFFASLAGSYVGRIDAATYKVQVLEPPTKDQGARRVWADSKGMLWVAEWNSGNLSRYDPKTGAWKAWKAPGERPRVYAVYVDEADRPWISEWDRQLIMRLDPATGKWDTYSSSSGAANVRQIHGRKGEVWTPESASGKLVVYRYR